MMKILEIESLKKKRLHSITKENKPLKYELNYDNDSTLETYLKLVFVNRLSRSLTHFLLYKAYSLLSPTPNLHPFPCIRDISYDCQAGYPHICNLNIQEADVGKNILSLRAA